jgi:hypothetical protein
MQDEGEIHLSMIKQIVSFHDLVCSMIKTSDDFNLFTNFFKYVQMLLMDLYLAAKDCTAEGQSMILIDQWA